MRICETNLPGKTDGSGETGNVPGDPARNAIAASDELDGRDRRGSDGIFGRKKGRPRRAARTGLGEKLADGLGLGVVKIKLGAVCP